MVGLGKRQDFFIGNQIDAISRILVNVETAKITVIAAKCPQYEITVVDIDKKKIAAWRLSPPS